MDRHALHGGLPGGAVKQSTCGILEDVPVPRKMSSIGLGTVSSSEDNFAMCKFANKLMSLWKKTRGIIDGDRSRQESMSKRIIWTCRLP